MFIKTTPCQCITKDIDTKHSGVGLWGCNAHKTPESQIYTAGETVCHPYILKLHSYYLLLRACKASTYNVFQVVLI